MHQPTGRDSEEDNTWGGYFKPCPKCETLFVSIVPNRVCPKCGHPFNTSETYPYPYNVSQLPFVVSWSNGQLPLMTAAKMGHLEIITLLLDAGAAVDKGRANVTPLMVACYMGHLDAVRFLIKRGANVNAQATTPDRVREKISPIIIAGNAGNIELVKILWEAGVPSANKNATLLAEAARRGNLGEIRSLLKAGADPNEQDPLTRDLALERAAERCDVEAVKILIAAGAIVHPPPSGRMPRVLCAVRKFANNKPDDETLLRCLETCRLLIGAGARVTGSYFGFDALSAADESGSKPLIEFLKMAAKAEKTISSTASAKRARKKP
jgi:ankyrin repeat protein